MRKAVDLKIRPNVVPMSTTNAENFSSKALRMFEIEHFWRKKAMATSVCMSKKSVVH